MKSLVSTLLVKISCAVTFFTYTTRQDNVTDFYSQAESVKVTEIYDGPVDIQFHFPYFLSSWLLRINNSNEMFLFNAHEDNVGYGFHKIQKKLLLLPQKTNFFTQRWLLSIYKLVKRAKRAAVNLTKVGLEALTLHPVENPHPTDSCPPIH